MGAKNYFQSQMRRGSNLTAIILGLVFISVISGAKLGTVLNSNDQSVQDKLKVTRRSLQVSDTKLKDCFWYNFQQNLRTQILPGSIFYEKIYDILLEEGISVVVSLCKQIGPEFLKECPHDDAPHKYVIVAKPSCNIYKQDDSIDGWKFPSVNKNTAKEFSGLIELKLTKKPSSLRGLLAHSDDFSTKQLNSVADMTLEALSNSQRVLQESHSDHKVTKTPQGNYVVELYYENEAQLGTITDPLYSWPFPSIMPIITIAESLVMMVLLMYFKMDDKIHIFLQAFVVVTFAAEYFFQDLWPTKGTNIAWLHLVGIPLITFLIFVKRGNKSTYIANFYKITCYVSYLFIVLDYPASSYRILKGLGIYVLGVVGVILLSLKMQKERRRQKELACSLATSLLIFLLIRNIVEYQSNDRDQRSTLGTFFRTRHQIAVAWNSRFYESLGQEIKLYWAYIPPLIYIPAMLRYFLVMHRYSKENAMGFDSHPILEGDISFEINTNK